MRAHLPYDWSSPATLAANRAGVLTAEQWKLIGRPLNWGCLLIGPTMLFACFFGLAIAAARNGALSGFLFVAVPFVIVAALLGVNCARARARNDAVSGRLVQTQGQVVWRGVRYVAEVSGRRLRPLRHYALPAPGPYDFFYLARSGLLLSAEPLRGMVLPVPGLVSGEPAHGVRAASLATAASPDDTRSTEMMGSELARLALLDALARTLHFSLQDLTANRAGRLSAVQRRKLGFDVIDTFFGTLGGVTGAIVLVLGALAAAAYSFGPPVFPGQTAVFRRLFQAKGAPFSPLLEVALALLALLLVVGGVAAFLATRPILHDVWAGHADSIEGELHAETGVIRAAKVYYYVVRTGMSEDGERTSMRFTVSPEAYRALVGGEVYRLYYLPHLHTLLSIEPLAPPALPGS